VAGFVSSADFGKDVYVLEACAKYGFLYSARPRTAEKEVSWPNLRPGLIYR